MADTFLTEKDDTYEHTKGKEWTAIRALGGNDVIIIHGNAKVVGGPGNDIITNDVSDNPNGGAAYWDSPSAIYVDLEAGYALDGFGTRDTLINIRDLDTSGQNGDVIFGSSKSDSIWLNGFNWKNRKPGSATLDARGGNDTVNFYDSKLSDFQIKVSADGRTVQLTGNNGYSATLKNVENLMFKEVFADNNQIDRKFSVIDLIDTSSVGSELLLRGYMGWQTAKSGNGVALTYSFMSQAPATGGEGGVGFSTFSDAQKQIVRDLFATLQNQTGIVFTEATGDAGQIRLGVNQQTNTRAYSFIPDEFKNDARAGDVWIDQETTALMRPGQEGYYVLLHELGHALGLQHPLIESDTSGATVLLNAFSTTNNTVMLDVNAANNGGAWPSWFGNFDLQALRNLYGSKAYATGNNNYKLSDTTGNMLILDDGGVDTLDASATSVPARIDLRPGKSSSIGLDTDGTTQFNNVSIAAGSLIEGVVGTVYDDVIIGNAQNNVVTFLGGNDLVDGGAGYDLLRIWQSDSEFKINKDTVTGYWYVDAINNTLGHVELQNIERIYFENTSLALDTGPTENAGITAKILGAVFGKDALSNKQYVGIGLSFLDAGWTYDNLAGLALSAAGASTNDQIVSLLWKNIIGFTASAVDKAPYISLLQNGMSPGALAHLAADSSYNTSNINLVGLMQSGIEFVPS